MKAKLVIEMPRGCYSCPLFSDTGDKIICRSSASKTWRGELTYKELPYGTDVEVKQSWCPLIPVEDNE